MGEGGIVIYYTVMHFLREREREREGEREKAHAPIANLQPWYSQAQQ